MMNEQRSAFPKDMLRSAVAAIVTAIVGDLEKRKGLRQVWEQLTVERRDDIVWVWNRLTADALDLELKTLVGSLDDFEHRLETIQSHDASEPTPNYYEIHLRALEREFAHESRLDHWPNHAQLAFRKAERWVQIALRSAEQGRFPADRYRDPKEETVRIVTVRPRPYTVPKETP